MPRTMHEDRDRARRLATGIVSIAIIAIGLAMLVTAVILPFRGGLPLIFLAILVGLVAVAVLFGGLFFHLIPSRLESLAEEKREYDRRQREEESRGGPSGPRP